MSHKHNGAMVQPAGPKGNRKDAGDDSHSNCSSHGDVPTVVYPENIQKRLNALKNTHMEVQKLEQEMHVKLFLLEAQYHQQMTPLLKKRAEIISGTYEPTANEIKFELPEGSPIVETTPADGSIGIPKFWFTVLSNCMLTNEWIEEHDEEVLGYLQDIRVVYEEKPLGFKLEFEFAENLYFTNKVLARSYVFDEALNKEELYVNNGLTPKSTSGTVIDWKEGKNLTKKVTVAQQRNKKTGERRQVKSEKDQETFFTFFSPAVTDLAALMKPTEGIADQIAEENIEKVQQAEVDYEVASLLRSRVISRALLIFTGEDDEDASYSDDEYDDEEESDEDGAEHEDQSEPEESDDDEDARETPGKKGKGGGKGAGKGPRR